MFSPLFLFLCFSQVAANFTFISKTSFILLLLKGLPSNATKQLLIIIVEHKLEEAFSDSIRPDVQLGPVIVLSILISQQLLRLTSLYSLSFLK